MSSSNFSNGTVNWMTYPEELVYMLKHPEYTQNAMMFAKYTLFDYDIKKNELRLVEKAICPVCVELNGDMIEWEIQNHDDIIGPEYGEINIHDTRIGDNCLYYRSDTIPCDNGSPEFVSTMIITAFALVDLTVPDPTFPVALNRKGATLAINAADTANEAAVINSILDKIVPK